jgi:hypothetical protein
MRNFGETTLPLIGRQWTEKKVRKDSHTGFKTTAMRGLKTIRSSNKLLNCIQLTSNGFGQPLRVRNWIGNY